MGANDATRFEGTHLAGNHIGDVAAKRLAGLIAPDGKQYSLGVEFPPAADIFNTPLAVVYPTALGAEASNIRNVAGQVYDANADELEMLRLVKVTALSAAMVPLEATAATLSEGTLGSVFSTDAQASVLVATDTQGRFDLDLEDVTGTLTGAIWLSLEVVDGRGLAPVLYPVTFA